MKIVKMVGLRWK